MITEKQDKALRSIGCEYTYPDIDKAIRWMRDVKGVHVATEPNFEYIASQWIYELFVIKGKDWILFDSLGSYISHDIAQSAGLDASIEYVKNQEI